MVLIIKDHTRSTLELLLWSEKVNLKDLDVVTVIVYSGNLHDSNCVTSHCQYSGENFLFLKAFRWIIEMIFNWKRIVSLFLSKTYSHVIWFYIVLDLIENILISLISYISFYFLPRDSFLLILIEIWNELSPLEDKVFLNEKWDTEEHVNSFLSIRDSDSLSYCCKFWLWKQQSTAVKSRVGKIL